MLREIKKDGADAARPQATLNKEMAAYMHAQYPKTVNITVPMLGIQYNSVLLTWMNSSISMGIDLKGEAMIKYYETLAVVWAAQAERD